MQFTCYTKIISQLLFFREVLCEDALRSIVGNNLLWSASRDTQEGTLGKLLLTSILIDHFL